jgi:hypothetical protein
LDHAIPHATTINSVSGKVQAGSQDGDYSSVANGTAVAFSTPLNFIALESVAPSTVTPWWSFTVGTTTYSFSIVGDVAVNQYVSGGSSFLNISGTGDAAITGYATNDDASFDISIGKTGASKLTFGNSTSASAVPDSGTTALLIGLGLAGVGIGMIAERRMLAKSAA